MTALPQQDRELTVDEVAVAETVARLMRTFNRTRAQIVAAAAHDVEWSAQIVLKCLSREGPIRSSTLAERVQCDPSTVSRQVAALVKDQLVERRADPEDGRASLLVLTDKAGEVLRDHDDVRNRHFARLLAQWSADDVSQFARLLQRFTTDFESATNIWISDQTATQSGSAERNR